MVELVKLALDAKKPVEAQIAARELNGLFEYSDRGGSGRSHVRGGQLVLSGWLRYLADKGDERDPASPDLRALATPDGTWAEILSARNLAERGVAPFGRWDLWEMETLASGRAQLLELSHYIDLAELAALASSYGPLPPARDQETASTYERFVGLLASDGPELGTKESDLKRRLAEEVEKWEAAENARLSAEPLSQERIADLQTALRETLDAEQRLASKIPTTAEIPDVADQSLPILGMNFRVSRHYLVDEAFNQTYADPDELGRIIARGFMEAEDEKIVGEILAQQANILDPTPRGFVSRSTPWAMMPSTTS